MFPMKIHRETFKILLNDMEKKRNKMYVSPEMFYVENMNIYVFDKKKTRKHNNVKNI